MLPCTPWLFAPLFLLSTSFHSRLTLGLNTAVLQTNLFGFPVVTLLLPTLIYSSFLLKKKKKTRYHALLSHCWIFVCIHLYLKPSGDVLPSANCQLSISKSNQLCYPHSSSACRPFPSSLPKEYQTATILLPQRLQPKPARPTPPIPMHL